MEIVAIGERSDHLEEVIELARANAATLGFLPRGAFIKYASENQLLVALDESREVLGYLLYGTSRRKMLAYIVHLCVRQSQRGKGIAKALFEKLKKATQDTLHGIRVRCRRDYEADTLWPKLGFSPVDEMPGRSKQGTKLTVWWFDHGHPTLFTYADEQRSGSRLKVVIDANVFFQLQKASVPSNEESQALLADWMQENIELCITKEILNEIQRHEDEEERNRGRAFASGFTEVTSKYKPFQDMREALKDFFPDQMDDSDESDLRHLAWSIASGVQFFVTRDEELLEKEDDIYDNFGIRIIRPSDLVINQDQLMREAEYQPARLAGSQIKIERISSGQESFLDSLFRAPQEETKGKFRQRLHLCLSHPRTCETSIIQSAERPLALIAHRKQNRHELEIPLFRVMRDSLSATLARYLALRAVVDAHEGGQVLTEVTDPYMSSDVNEALQETGFIFMDGLWVKANLSTVGTTEELILKLVSLSTDFPSVSQYFRQMANTLTDAHSANDVVSMLQIEHALSPAKMVNIDIPAFVIPIRPEWAMHLFDPYIAKQDLFGGKPNLILRMENVYYSASRTNISAPSRILWYVSKGSGKYQGTMSIRAASLLEEVVIDYPKELYSQFRRLGIYQWKNVLNTAGGRMDRKIKAFRFSNTELFSTPISREDLCRIWREETGDDFRIQWPIPIPAERFFRLYERGMGIR
jgi:predicted nucleic acid-binding protein/GNAT superfamily N-acetyltransferase